MDADIIRSITVYFIPIIFAITLHEAAHGYVARLFGDQTALVAGRISVNPARHIDPVGTILIPVLTLMFGGVLFGWAKPVPVDPRQMRNPRFNMIAVAAAGPVSNLLMAFIWAILASINHSMDWGEGFLWQVCWAGIQFNLMLMVFNLLPIPPLDGGKILLCILPPRLASRIAYYENYGFIVVLLLLWVGILSPIIVTGMKFFAQIIIYLVF